MTWEELKEEAKKMGYIEVKKFPYGKPEIGIVNEAIEIAFYKDGTVECDAHNDDCCGKPFIKKRTPEQMYQIMKTFAMMDAEEKISKKFCFMMFCMFTCLVFVSFFIGGLPITICLNMFMAALYLAKVINM